jgi:hypothetical protein
MEGASLFSAHSLLSSGASVTFLSGTRESTQPENFMTQSKTKKTNIWSTCHLGCLVILVFEYGDLPHKFLAFCLHMKKNRQP